MPVPTLAELIQENYTGDVEGLESNLLANQEKAANNNPPPKEANEGSFVADSMKAPSPAAPSANISGGATTLSEDSLYITPELA